MPVDTTKPPDQPTAVLDRIPDRVKVPEDRGESDPGQTHIEHVVIGTTLNNAVAPSPIGFRARCVIADNFTNQYIYIPQGETWVPPFVTGYRVLISPTTVAQANVLTTGSGAAQIGATSGQIYVLTWCERVILSTPLALLAAHAVP